MSWQWWCACLGLILVAAGAALAFIGFRETWSDFVVNEKFWRALTTWLPRWWGNARKVLVAAYNRFIRHEKFVNLDDQAAAVSASAHMDWNVLPTEFPEDEELHEVARRLWKHLSDLELRLGDNIRQANQSLSAAHEDLGKRVTVVDEKVVRVAVGGLSLQAWGLILVTGGAALSSAPALAQVSSPHVPAPAHTSGASHGVGHTAAQASGSLWAADVPGWITAVGTALLAIFAILTTIYAVRAFRKQSQEVSHQAEMLKVQSEQLAEQRKVNAQQIRVLALQAGELRESLDERKREAEQRRSAQASRVFISQADGVFVADDPSAMSEMLDEDEGSWTDITKAEAEAQGGWHVAELTVVNTSDQPVYDAQLRWHRGSAGHGWPNPEPLGTVMPGGEIKRTRRFPLGTNMPVSGAVLWFRDAAGVIWMRRPDGGLTEQP